MKQWSNLTLWQDYNIIGQAVRDKLFNHSEVIAEDVSSSCRLRNIGEEWMRREICFFEEVASLAVEA
jgi:hypothetical protein